MSSRGQSKASLAQEKDEVAKRIGASIIIISTDGSIRAPVITLQGEKSNPYGVVEKHFRPDILIGAERFWKVIRAMYSPPLETWRPRVNGVQLKALQGARLPEAEQEWEAVQQALEHVEPWIVEGSSLNALVGDLRALAAFCEEWWDHRTKRDIHGGLSRDPMKRALLLPNPPAAIKRQNTGLLTPNFGAGTSQPVLAPQHSGPLAGDQSNSLRSLADAAADAPIIEGGLAADVMTSEQAAHLMVEAHHHPASANGDAMHTTPSAHASLAPSLQPRVEQQRPAHPTPQQSTQFTPSPLHRSCLPRSQTPHQEAVVLNVGGRRFMTTAATLLAVEGSFLWKLISVQQAAGTPKPGAEFFIDRNGSLFESVLEYHRSARFERPEQPPPLPQDTFRLQQLQREAEFFGLPGLVESIREQLALCSGAAHMDSLAGPRRQQAREALNFDSVYAETSFQKTSDALEAQRVQVMQVRSPL
eukprot:jgi/Astpho2/4299/fgenesh1_pg.00064_%23_81_t